MDLTTACKEANVPAFLCKSMRGVLDAVVAKLEGFASAAGCDSSAYVPYSALLEQDPCALIDAAIEAINSVCLSQTVDRNCRERGTLEGEIDKLCEDLDPSVCAKLKQVEGVVLMVSICKGLERGRRAQGQW